MKNREQIAYHLDELDKKIIDLLMDNGKSSLVNISQKIGISTTAVHQRIKKLEQAEVIENSISLLNPKRIGYNVISYIGIYLEKPHHYEEILKSLDQIHEVVEAHCTTGNYTIFIKVLCRDNSHLMEILKNIQHLKGVERTETFISLEQSINRQLKV